jgi:hypothetical protein
MLDMVSQARPAGEHFADLGFELYGETVPLPGGEQE